MARRHRASVKAQRSGTGLYDPRNRLPPPRLDPLDDVKIIREKGLHTGQKVRCEDGRIRIVHLILDGEIFLRGIMGKVNPRTIHPVSD